MQGVKTIDEMIAIVEFLREFEESIETEAKIFKVAKGNLGKSV